MLAWINNLGMGAGGPYIPPPVVEDIRGINLVQTRKGWSVRDLAQFAFQMVVIA